MDACATELTKADSWALPLPDATEKAVAVAEAKAEALPSPWTVACVGGW